MRDEWRKLKLGNVLTARKDYTQVVADEFYRIVGVQRSGWGMVDRDPVRGDSMKFEKLMELHEDDVVYRTITAFEAPSAVVGSEFEGAFVTPQTFPTYSIDRSQLLPGYMALITTSPVFHEAMSSRCVGSVLRRKTLGRGAFESIPITLPPLDEQRRIVDLIETVDNAVTAAELEHETAVRLWRELTGSPGRDHRTVAIGDVVSVAKSGGTPSRSIAANYDGVIPWLKSGEVRGRDIGETEEHISEAALSSSSAWVVPPGAVLIAMYGATAGQVGQTTAPMSTNQAVLALLADTSVVLQDMLYHLIAAAAGELKTKAVGAAQPNISRQIVMAHEVALPPLSAQPAVTEILGSSLRTADAARATAEALRALRSNLLTVLLSGEHEIPDSYDVFLEEVA